MARIKDDLFCSLKSIDTSFSDYLITDFWLKSMVEKYNE